MYSVLLPGQSLSKQSLNDFQETSNSIDAVMMVLAAVLETNIAEIPAKYSRVRLRQIKVQLTLISISFICLIVFASLNKEKKRQPYCLCQFK